MCSFNERASRLHQPQRGRLEAPTPLLLVGQRQLDRKVVPLNHATVQVGGVLIKVAAKLQGIVSSLEEYEGRCGWSSPHCVH